MASWQSASDTLLSAYIQNFGIPVTYERPGLAPFTVTGVPGHPDDLDPTVLAQNVTLDVNRADFAGVTSGAEPAKDDVVTINGVSYTAYFVHIDFDGKVKIFLTKN